MGTAIPTLTLPIPQPVEAWKHIAAIPIVCYFGLRAPEFTAEHVIKFRDGVDPLLGSVCSALSQQLSQTTHLTCALEQMSIDGIAAMLGCSPADETWFVAVNADLDTDNPAHVSLWRAWGPLFDAVMRFAIPTEEPHITKLDLGNSTQAISLSRTSNY